MLDLAHQVVKDGEGATKFVTVNVTGAASDADARTQSPSRSPIRRWSRPRIAGEDPNWGRIVMAVGKSGAAADRDTLSIRFGDILVAENGWVAPDYREDRRRCLHEAARDRDRRRYRARARARPPSGPAT